MTHYGLHRRDEFIFLHEQGGGRCVTPGYGRVESPFRVPARHWLPCPHRYDVIEPGPILEHPLVDAMGPDQCGGFFHVRDTHTAWLWRLLAMTSGANRVVEAYWTFKRPRARRLQPFLTLTNLAPFALVDLAPADLMEIETLAALPRLRNLVVCGPIKPMGAVTLDPAGLDPAHDWPAEGRRRLHHLIRRSTP